jgi:AbrB family looped-hinge helix DNA binding protein
MTFTRRMDDLGRIVLPKEMREAMQIKEGEAFDVTNTYDGKIVLEKSKPINLDTVEVRLNIPRDRKMYIIRFDDCAGEVVLLTENQIKLINWLRDNDYLKDDVYCGRIFRKEN